MHIRFCAGFLCLFISLYAGSVYDSFYGTDSFNTQVSHENASIHGTYSSGDGYASGKKDDDSLTELTYTLCNYCSGN